MITPQEIKEQCLKNWKELLSSLLDGTGFFPLELNRIGKVSSKDILQHLTIYRQSIAELQKYAGIWGYELIMEERNFEKIGYQQVPVRIRIPSLEVYLRITRKRGELNEFTTHLSYIRENLPQLEDWCRQNKNFPYLVSHDTWKETLSVCRYFLEHPLPGLYLRELPVDVHTKYIEQNQGLIKSLLDSLLPSDAIRDEEKGFEKRYGLKSAEPLVRIRYLDPTLSPVIGWEDVSLPYSTFFTLNIECRYIFLAENKMNFLTLPRVPDSIAIWSGGGFNIGYLKDICWLKDKQLFYWGDLDAHGMQILHQCRSYYPTTLSFLMDWETFNRYPQFVTKGTPTGKLELPLLTTAEKELYLYLQEHNVRLEQEHIRQCEVIQAVRQLMKDYINKPQKI